ncbi:MAG: hypothetical protein KAQ98_11855 [Bacteriovoracaceae bacterium]|nr:hypothetical protein [Bacteriovoracaceae bacterium]
MDKSLNKQVKHLVSALESIRDDHAPWHGEDAVDMMNNAHDALVDWEGLKEGIESGALMIDEACRRC